MELSQYTASRIEIHIGPRLCRIAAEVIRYGFSAPDLYFELEVALREVVNGFEE